MKLNISTIRTLYQSELRMMLRDRRTIFVSLIIPLIVMPVMLFSSQKVAQKHEQKLEHTVYHYAVAGLETNAVRTILAAARKHLEAAAGTTNSSALRFEEKPATNALIQLNKGDLDLVLEGSMTNAPAMKNQAGNSPDPKLADEKASHAVAEAVINASGTESKNAKLDGLEIPFLKIIYRADREESSTALARMTDGLNKARELERASLLKENAFPVKPGEVAIVSDHDLATQGQIAGLTLGRIITAFVMLLLFSGGAVAATDSVVGEKERGTLETLLTTAAGRTEIVAAKHLVVLTVALVIILIQTANLLVYVGLKWIPVRANFAAAVPPSIGILLFALFLPLAAFGASVLLLTSSYAKSYKQAQMYFLPVGLLLLTPTLAPLLPGLSLNSVIVLVPIANIAVAAREILTGTFNWPMIAIAWLVTSAAAAWTTRLSVRSLYSEKLITVSDTDSVDFAGGPALYGRQVLVWFAALWALLLIVNNYMASLDVRAQVAINLPLLFFSATLLMIWRYRLNPREALALRAPKLWIWPAVLLAVPGGLLTGEGIFKLLNLFIPMPEEALKTFSEAVIPDGVSIWQLLFFLAVLPGVFEEITFRGMLLHGLHRRLHPVTLAVVVGTIFGLFHMDLFRLAPTAFLGMLLAAVVLQTGSIFPAMLWHALNNAFSVLASINGVPLDDLSPWAYAAGLPILGCAFWIIWRNRTPYPGLRVKRLETKGSEH